MAWVPGVDVSNYQRDVNWPQVAGAGIKFAWAKATEGTAYVDPFILTNLDGARAAGLLAGAYHFAHPNNSWFNEVGHFLLHSHPEAWTLPPVLDLEVPHPDGKAAATEWAHSFLSWLDARTPFKPVLYCGTYFPINHSELTEWPLWLPQYTAPLASNPDPKIMPSPMSPRPWSIWQYTCKGSVPGIRGECDRNVATEEWFEELTMPTMDEINAAIKSEGARVEKALTDEVNAAEERILDKLPTNPTYWSGIVAKLNKIMDKLGIKHA